jgi:tetratricopeptide (TPR) repeat protein
MAKHTSYSLSRARSAALTFGLLILAAPAGVHAQTQQAPTADTERWPIDPEHPDTSIPSTDDLDNKPMKAGYLLMDLVDLAEVAVKAKKYDEAVKEYDAIAKLVPERATAFSKLCEVYAAMGDTERALANCTIALSKPGARVRDAALFARLTSEQPEGPSAAEVAELDQVIDHLKRENVDAVDIAHIQCGIAVRLSDERRLKDCTATLQAKAPDDARTISYLFALALQQGNYGEGQRLLTRAKAVGINPDGIQKMKTAVRTIRFAWLRRLGAVLLGVGALGALLMGIRALARRSASTPVRV